MSLYFVAMMAGRFAGSRLVRRFPAPRVLTGAIAIAMASFPVLWLGRSPIVNLAGLFLVGIGVANFYPLIVGLTTEAAGARSDRAMARLSISGASALMTVPFVVGALSDGSGMKRGFALIFCLIAAELAAMLITYASIAGAAGPEPTESRSASRS